MIADVHTPEQRKRNMTAIKSKDTKPEMIVRRIVHRLGFRYRLHSNKLPGKPDLVLSKHSKVILVHGCFWHMHGCKYGRVTPKTNAAFWQEKRKSNVNRDKENYRLLQNQGWHVLSVWECQTRDSTFLANQLEQFLKQCY